MENNDLVANGKRALNSSSDSNSQSPCEKIPQYEQSISEYTQLQQARDQLRSEVSSLNKTIRELRKETNKKINELTAIIAELNETIKKTQSIDRLREQDNAARNHNYESSSRCRGCSLSSIDAI